MGWLKRILRVGGVKSPLCRENQVLVNDFRRSSQQCIDILRRCRTRDQVVEGLSRIARAGYDVSPVAANAAQQLESVPSLDAFRIRDDFIRQMEAFLLSARNL